METELNRTVFFAVIAFSGTVFTDTLCPGLRVGDPPQKAVPVWSFHCSSF